MKVWLGVKDKPKLDHGHWVLRMTVLAKTTRLHAEKIGLREEQSKARVCLRSVTEKDAVISA